MDDEFDIWTVILPAWGVAFSAFCIWLTVRIVNRRERWAKWTAVPVAIIAVPAIVVNYATGPSRIQKGPRDGGAYFPPGRGTSDEEFIAAGSLGD